MNIREAKKEILFKRFLGVVLGISALISTFVSMLKMLYFRIDDGTQFGVAIAKPLKSFVYWVYENTHQLIGWFWNHSPTPDHMNLAISENAYFIVIYLLIFVGAALFASGNQLAYRLRKIRQRIEDQLIEESIKGKNGLSREQIESDTEVPKSSIFSQFHQLYLAPIVVGLVVALLLKFMGV